MTKQRKKKKFNKLITLLILFTCITIFLLYYIDIFPIKYILIFSVLVILFVLFLIILLKSKKKFVNVIGLLLTIICLIFEILGIVYELNTINFFNQFKIFNYKTEYYNIIVLNSSKYENISDLENSIIAHLDPSNYSGLEKALKKIDNNINYDDLIRNDIKEVAESISDGSANALILEEAQVEMIEEEYYELYENFKIIDTIKIKSKTKDITKSVDVTKESFNIYFTGIDTYGSITKVSRSDVNIVASVNPKTNKILLTSVPRDYYVTLDKYDAKDKLTHAGIYGIETSVGTLENLLDTQINYYVKVNFTSLIKIVDAIDGIEINSNYAFKSKDGYYYKKGLNKLDGKEALSFVRERKAFKDGDRIRSQNQEIVLEAIINKVLTPEILVTYNDLLKSFEGNFITNLDEDSITKLIKNQIKEQKNWEIQSIVLEGIDDYDYTYSYKRQKLYVMRPDEESVINTQEKIKAILENS